MAKIGWIKITTDLFEDEKIRYIERLPEADSILIIWIKLLSLAGKCNDSGFVYLTKDIPYSNVTLSQIINRPDKLVDLALKEFKKLGMIEIMEGFISINNWEKHQNIDGMDKIREQNRKRAQKYRENKINNNVKSRDGNGTDKNKNKNKNKKDITQNAIDLSNLLFNEIMNNLSLTRYKNKKPDLSRWASDIDKLINIDKVNPFIIENVIRFVTKNDFWKKNILSGKKLRDQFDRLEVEMNTSKKQKPVESGYKEIKSGG